jgi:hypothetical protein
MSKISQIAEEDDPTQKTEMLGYVPALQRLSSRAQRGGGYLY